MENVIVSMDLVLNNLDVHIIKLDPFKWPRTIITTTIASPRELQKIRKWLENEDTEMIVKYFKEKYSLTHQKISLSYGKEIRDWLFENNSKKNLKNYNYRNRSQNSYEIQNFKNRK